MSDDISNWVKARNAVEDFFQPVTAAAVNFAHVIKDDAKAEASGDLKKAFVDGYTVYNSTTGTFNDRIIAGVSAFLLELIGDVVALVKKDAAAEVETPPAA